MNDLYRNGFFAPPRSLFLDPDENMTAHAKLVLLCLHSHRNDVNFLCNPSQHTIAKECKISVRSVSDAIQLLIDLEYIAIDHERSKRTNAYVFLFDIPHPNDALVADNAPIADKQQNNQSVVINNTTTWEQPVTDCSSDVFIFDQHLHNADLSLIAFANSLLTGIPNAQTVLDEFNFQIGEKKQQGAPIRNPQGYLTRLAKLAATGEFTPSGALEIAAKRKARAAKAVVKPAAPQPIQATSSAPDKSVEVDKQPSNTYTPSNTGKAAIAALRASIGQPKPKPRPDGVPTDEEKIAISAALRGMDAGVRGGSSFQHIAAIINRRNDANT